MLNNDVPFVFERIAILSRILFMNQLNRSTNLVGIDSQNGLKFYERFSDQQFIDSLRDLSLLDPVRLIMKRNNERVTFRLNMIDSQQ